MSIRKWFRWWTVDLVMAGWATYSVVSSSGTGAHRFIDAALAGSFFTWAVVDLRR